MRNLLIKFKTSQASTLGDFGHHCVMCYVTIRKYCSGSDSAMPLFQERMNRQVLYFDKTFHLS